MPDDEKQVLQRFVDSLFSQARQVTRLDVILRAEALDLPDDLLELMNLLPPGTYARHNLCDQLNSALKGHGWNNRYGSVE